MAGGIAIGVAATAVVAGAFGGVALAEGDDGDQEAWRTCLDEDGDHRDDCVVVGPLEGWPADDRPRLDREESCPEPDPARPNELVRCSTTQVIELGDPVLLEPVPEQEPDVTWSPSSTDADGAPQEYSW